MATSQNPHRVLVLAYDQLCTFEYGCAAEVFALKRPELASQLKRPWYAFEVHCVDKSIGKGASLQAAGGLQFKAPQQPALLKTADTIIIPGWKSVDTPPPQSLVFALQEAYQRGCRIATICSGVFVLAATGLLDGKRATTHWRYADELAQRYPAITVLPNDLYVDEGLLLTSAGSAAGLDMMLHMVSLDHGAQIANSLAQRLVVPLHREGGQSQFINRAVLANDKTRLSALMDWARAHLAEPLTVAQLADKAAMSTRTLQRAFLDSTGLTPLHWLSQERIYCAKTLLEHNKQTDAVIAQFVGFGSLQTFRSHFKKTVGVTPKAYRLSFSKKAFEPHSRPSITV